MRNKKVLMGLFVTLVLVLSMVLGAPVVSANGGVKTQMAVLIDGSGSISGGEFSTMTGALAAAVSSSAVVPQDGSLEICVVQFAGDSAWMEVPATVIDSQATADAVAAAIAGMTQAGGFTPLGAGIDVGTGLIVGSSNFSTAEWQVINISTDGRPEPDAQVAIAITARNAAIAAGIDEIDIEAIGIDTTWQNWLANEIAYPSPGVIVTAPPYPPRPPDPDFRGFVRPFSTFDEYAEAIAEKFFVIIEPPPVPTLSQWGIIVMAGLFAGLLTWTLKRKGVPIVRKNG
jgi:hypothetical protein